MPDTENPVILIADDDPSGLLILQEFLKPSGVEIITVTDGVMAFEESVKNTSIQLAIIDIRMPKMDGLEAVRLIRKYRSDLPVIIYTAVNDPEYKFLFKKLNCNDFLVKPVTPQEVINTVSKYLDLQVDKYSNGRYFLS
jgi:two-component system response regulator AtoC